MEGFSASVPIKEYTLNQMNSCNLKSIKLSDFSLKLKRSFLLTSDCPRRKPGFSYTSTNYTEETGMW
jgi:hypothetical protein